LIEIIFWTLAAWLSTSAFFVGIPTTMILRADARAAGTNAVIRRRFFLPIRRTAPLRDELVGKAAWVESFAPGRRKEWGRIVAIRDRTLLLEVRGEEREFRPRFESRGFAEGTGGATGALDDERAMVIV
jgi:hypothetical protein